MFKNSNNFRDCMKKLPNVFEDSFGLASMIMRLTMKVNKSIRPTMIPLLYENARRASLNIKNGYDAVSPYIKVMFLESARDLMAQILYDLDVIRACGVCNDRSILDDCLKVSGVVFRQLNKWLASLSKKYGALSSLPFSPTIHPTLEMMYPSSKYFRVRDDFFGNFTIKHTSLGVVDDAKRKLIDAKAEFDYYSQQDMEKIKKIKCDAAYAKNENTEQSILNTDYLLDPTMSGIDPAICNTQLIAKKIIEIIKSENPENLNEKYIEALLVDYGQAGNIGLMIDAMLRNPMFARNVIRYLISCMQDINITKDLRNQFTTAKRLGDEFINIAREHLTEAARIEIEENKRKRNAQKVNLTTNAADANNIDNTCPSNSIQGQPVEKFMKDPSTKITKNNLVNVMNTLSNMESITPNEFTQQKSQQPPQFQQQPTQ